LHPLIHAGAAYCHEKYVTEQLVKQCEAFARLGRHQNILDAVEQYAGKCDDTGNYYAGMASANIRLMDRAFASLKRVGSWSPLGPRAVKYAALSKAGRGHGTIAEAV
jgi:hypothetical protein